MASALLPLRLVCTCCLPTAAILTFGIEVLGLQQAYTGASCRQ